MPNYQNQKNYNRPPFTRNMVGGAGVMTQGEDFQIKIYNATGVTKQIAIFPGAALPLLCRQPATGENSGVTPAADGIYAIGGAIVPADLATEQNVIVFDNPEKLKKYLSEIDAVLNSGIESNDSSVTGKVIYCDTFTTASKKYLGYETDLKDIDDFLNKVAQVPMIIDSIKITGDSAETINNAYLKYKDMTAYADQGETKFPFNVFTDAKNNQDNMITVNTFEKWKKLLQIDHSSLIVLSMPGSSTGTTTMTLNFNVKKVKDLAALSIENAINELATRA